MPNDQKSPLWTEWKIFLRILFKPLVICPTMFSILLLFFANADTGIDKKFSVLLNILASITLAFAGGFLTDAYKSLTGDEILIKKGLSAVRNLSLSRLKINSIAKRSKNASKDEMENLLGMLEKDIANATQDWNDIIPGATETIEANYVLLREKEEELKMAQIELEQITQKNQSNLNQKEKLLEEQNKKIAELTKQVNKLEISTSSPNAVMNAWNLADKNACRSIRRNSLAGALLGNTICTKCGKLWSECECPTG